MPVEVQDFRTQTGDEAGTIAEHGLKSVEEIRGGSEREIVVELHSSGERSEKSAETGQKVQEGAGNSFEQLLARELRGDLSTDIVKQATIVLRDGGEGTIKLSLKPESLGKVKIHLEIAENRILGHIFVDNEEALRAFEQEIHTLEQSFRDSGFEASLNAALDYQNGGQRWKEEMLQPFFSERFAASYEESSPMEFTGDFSAGYGINAINVLA
jgi:flagellar hook-length control protein FliK